MQPISTNDKLPENRQYILWWHPQGKHWQFGTYYIQAGQCKPGYFQGIEACWYICKGPTFWAPEPPPPSTQ